VDFGAVARVATDRPVLYSQWRLLPGVRGSPYGHDNPVWHTYLDVRLLWCGNDRTALQAEVRQLRLHAGLQRSV